MEVSTPIQHAGHVELQQILITQRAM